MSKSPPNSVPPCLRGESSAVAWIPCSQSLPDSDLTVLIHMPQDTDPVWMGYWDGEDWRLADAMKCFNTVTHWAPFPEPPKEAA